PDSRTPWAVASAKTVATVLVGSALPYKTMDARRPPASFRLKPSWKYCVYAMASPYRPTFLGSGHETKAVQCRCLDLSLSVAHTERCSIVCCQQHGFLPSPCLR